MPRGIYHMDLQLYIIWNNAIQFYDYIIKELSNFFIILFIFYENWNKSETVNKVKEIYGFSEDEAIKKTNICGYGNIIIIIVQDKNPKYILYETKYGNLYVNKHAVESKKKIRHVLNNANAIHGTIIDFEFEKDVYTCINKSKNEIMDKIKGEENEKYKHRII